MTGKGMRSRFTGPNVLIGVGMLPLALFALVVTIQSKYPADLGLLFLGGLLALASYAALVAAWTIGLVWATRIARETGATPPIATNAWIIVAAIMLVAPWVLLAAR